MNQILQQRIEEAANEFEKEGLRVIFENGANFILNNLWISVEEALPEKNKMCFVRKETELGIIYDADYVDFEGKWFFNFNRTSIKSMVITHWMPIPELKGDKK